MLKKMCFGAVLFGLFLCQPVLAQNGGSVFFTRTDTGAAGEMGVNGRMAGLVNAALPASTVQETLPNAWSEITYANGQAMSTSAVLRGVERLRSSMISLLSARNFTSRGATTTGANHTIAANLEGDIIVFDQAATGNVNAATAAIIRAEYTTSPPQSSLPLNPANRFATMKNILGFLVVGMPVESLFTSAPPLDHWDFGAMTGGGFGGMPDTNAFAGTAYFDQYLVGALGEFRQRVIVKNTDLELMHLGGGVFVTAGSYSYSTEMHNAEPWHQYVKFDFGGVNNTFITWERVMINGERVGVAVLQHSRAFAVKCPLAVPTEDGEPVPQLDIKNFLWGFSNLLNISANDNASPDGTLPPPNPAPPITLQ
ncbi:MAG: hypothetical protein U0930_10630 [Pirellulales bacterium]